MTTVSISCRNLRCRPNGLTQRLVMRTDMAHIAAARMRQARPPIQPAGVWSTKGIRRRRYHRTPSPLRLRPHSTRSSLGIARCHLSILAARRLLVSREVSQAYHTQRMAAATRGVQKRNSQQRRWIVTQKPVGASEQFPTRISYIISRNHGIQEALVWLFSTLPFVDG